MENYETKSEDYWEGRLKQVRELLSGKHFSLTKGDKLSLEALENVLKIALSNKIAISSDISKLFGSPQSNEIVIDNELGEVDTRFNLNLQRNLNESIKAFQETVDDSNINFQELMPELFGKNEPINLEQPGRGDAGTNTDFMGRDPDDPDYGKPVGDADLDPFQRPLESPNILGGQAGYDPDAILDGQPGYDPDAILNLERTSFDNEEIETNQSDRTDANVEATSPQRLVDLPAREELTDEFKAFLRAYPHLTTSDGKIAYETLQANKQGLIMDALTLEALGP